MNEVQRQAIGTLLRQGAWFGSLPPALQERILAKADVRTFAKGQVIQHEDAHSAGFMVVLEGQVSLLRHVSDDEPVLIHVGGPGFWFGEVGVLLEGSTLVTAIAQSPLRVLVLAKTEFERIVAEEPRYYAEFARLALERLRILMRYLAETIRLSPDYRLRLRLADLAETQRSQTKAEGTSVLLDLSQSELAGIIGLSRQKLSGRLRRLQEEGWVELAPRRIRVLNPSGLRATAADGFASGH
jgi:CRP/FNR family cyclic AMP-dependent transcriptional regulator